MIQIRITNGYSDGTLDLECNGSPCDGDCCAKQGWKVHWKVENKDEPNIEVESISGITMKTGPGTPASTNIFPRRRPPRPHKDNYKHWKAKVKNGAPVGAEYHYTIYWKDNHGNNYECDPKIAVMPSNVHFLKLIVGFILGCLGLLSLEFLLRKRSRSKLTKNH